METDQLIKAQKNQHELLLLEDYLKQKKSNLRCVTPEAYFCPKVNFFASGFLILQISHRSKCSFILINFSTGLFLNKSNLLSQSAFTC